MEAEQVLKMLEGVLDAKLKPLQQEMTDMKQEMTGMKQDIAGIKQEMTGMKQDIAGIKHEMTDIKQDISNLHSKLDLLASGQPDDTLALLQAMKIKLENLQKDIEFTFLKTSKNELEINRLKTQ
ncbi:hypothetical protein [Paenibacillus jiagnxiensis]|uniref:hypothetical protein n=1 Tax=Paenibacillus jiagnxiensis TaxID=3228926 RepID=UPI0033B71957